jgi:primosomal protein N' (replication factor Y)
MILHKSGASKLTVFRCHQCGETRDANEVCRNCKSWKLAAFGSGIDKVTAELKKNFPGLNIFEINKDVATTSQKAINIIKDFYEKRGSILVGTEMAFSYLHKKVGSAAIASFDSLFSVPDFRIREKIFRIILQTQNLSKGKFLIQSRNVSDSTIEFALSGNILDFYAKEMEDRRALGYPPFGTFIKVTARGAKNFVIKETENLKNLLKEYDPIIFSSVQEKKGEQSAVNGIIKLRKENWPDNDILSILKSIPPHFEIKVDPDNLL